MVQLPGFDITINKTTAPADLEWSAHVMAANEPWITLERGYEDSLQLMLDPVADVYILSKDRERVGAVVIKLKGAFTGYIQSIVIDKKFRGRGIGAAALNYIESIIFKSSPNAFICVSAFNTEAFKLYKRLGYEKIGVLHDYIARGQDEILMRKTAGSWNEFRHKS